MLKTFTLNLIFFTVPSLLFAQQRFNPEILKKRIASKDGYSSRKNDERYEGLYTKNFGNERFVLVSVLKGSLRYELSDKNKLVFEHPKIPNLGEIGVSGSSYGMDRFYHIDFVIPSEKKSVVIPMKDVMTSSYIYANHLGIFGYLGNAGKPSVYIPIWVRQDGTKPKDGEPVALNITIVGDEAMSSISWKYARGTGSAGLTDGGKVDGDFSARQAIHIPLNFPKEVKTGETVLIQIKGVSRDQKKNVDVLSFNLIVTR